MAMKKPQPDRTVLHVRSDTVDKIDVLIKHNPMFKIPADVIDFAINLLIQMEKKK